MCQGAVIVSFRSRFFILTSLTRACTYSFFFTNRVKKLLNFFTRLVKKNG